MKPVMEFVVKTHDGDQYHKVDIMLSKWTGWKSTEGLAAHSGYIKKTSQEYEGNVPKFLKVKEGARQVVTRIYIDGIEYTPKQFRLAYPEFYI